MESGNLHKLAHEMGSQSNRDLDHMRPHSSLPGVSSRVSKRFAGHGSTTPMPDIMQLAVKGQPSLDAYQRDGTGNAVVSLRRQTQYMDYVKPNDLVPMRHLGERVFNMMKAMSNGPYSARVLARLGHPYGVVQAAGKLNALEARGVPRRVGGVGSINHARGIKGSVPTMSVINRQSGTLLSSWRWNYTVDSYGITLNWWNTAKSKKGAPYPYFLMAGTSRMAAHGPWTYAPLRYMESINKEWSRVVKRAYMRARAEEMIERSL